MSRSFRYILATTMLVLTLSACGDAPAQPGQPTATVNLSSPTSDAGTGTAVAEPTTGTSTSPTSVQGGDAGVDRQGTGNASVIDVVVSGGHHAGTYQRRSETATCSANLTGAGSFGNQYSDASITRGLSSVQLIIDDREAATKLDFVH